MLLPEVTVARSLSKPVRFVGPKVDVLIVIVVRNNAVDVRGRVPAPIKVSIRFSDGEKLTSS
jgi:hypothetical protein